MKSPVSLPPRQEIEGETKKRAITQYTNCAMDWCKTVGKTLWALLTFPISLPLICILLLATLCGLTGEFMIWVLPVKKFPKGLVHAGNQLVSVAKKVLDCWLLTSNQEGTINWDTRLKISIGAAKGLAYLHEECQPRIIHRDIKAANILVGSSFEAKVADFGMAKIFPDGISLIVASNLIGTHGYLAPECSRGEIREKSDTFSFGVVILELITGKKPIITRPVFSNDSYPFETLANWARPLLTEALQNGNYDSLVDSRLYNIYNYDEMNRMIACAAACVQQSAQDRPLMSKVALVLAGQTSPDDLFIRGISDVIHTASISSMEFQESS